MTDTQAAEMKSYVVVRAFHLGEVGVNLSVGDTLQFNGSVVVHERTSKQYEAPSLRLAIIAKHVVENDGTVEFKRPEKVARPAPQVVVEDHDDLVVAHIELPDEVKAAGRSRKIKSTEETAKTRAETAERRVMVEDQRVVGKATRERPVRVKAASVSDAEAAATKEAQEADATVVGTSNRTRIQELMAAEGIGTDAQTGRTPVVVDGDSDARVVARVKSAEEVEADLKRQRSANPITAEDLTMSPEEEAALKADIELAKSKREGRVPSGAGVAVAPEAPTATRTKAASTEAPVAEVKTADNGYPVGFPHNDHWRRRLKWCRTNQDNAAALKLVYSLASEAFQGRMVKEFPDITFE